MLQRENEVAAAAADVVSPRDGGGSLPAAASNEGFSIWGKGRTELHAASDEEEVSLSEL